MRRESKTSMCSLTRRALLKQGAGALTVLSAAQFLGSCESGQLEEPVIESAALKRPALPKTIAGVRIPDSAVALAAADLVRAVSSESLYNHCVRTFLFASLGLKKMAAKFDEELVFIGSILHDLGLVDSYMTENERFEVDGADAAVEFLRQWNLPQPQLDTVWDAIALHTSIGIVSRKHPNVAAVSLGSGMDMGGIMLDQLEPDDIDEVLREFPRLGFKAEAIRTVLHICEKKPFSTVLTAFAEVGRRHNPLFLVPTLEDIFLLAPFPE